MRGFLPLLLASAALVACGESSPRFAGTQPSPATPTPTPTPTPAPPEFDAAVYVGTNSNGDIGNFVVAFGRRANGELVPIDAYVTGGTGRAAFRNPGDPARLNSLVSEDSLLTIDDQYLLVVNAGSDDITSFRINEDYSLSVVDKIPSGGTMPVSLARRGAVIQVANADEDGVFSSLEDQSGNIVTFRIDIETGKLTRVEGSSRSLGVRPSDIEYSIGGRHLLVSGHNAGSATLGTPSLAQLTSFAVRSDGTLGPAATGTAISTLPGNVANRNLPSAIGIETYERMGRHFVVVAEARTISSEGLARPLSLHQAGSVSTWEIGPAGELLAREQDFRLSPSDAEATQAGWISLGSIYSVFWVSTATGASIHGYGLGDDGSIARGEKVIQGAPAMPGSADPLAGADGFVDSVVSNDGRYLYQVVGLGRAVDVYEIDTLVAINLARRQRADTNLLPSDNLQGIVTVGGYGGSPF
jgi:hypothetical protein